MNKKFKKNNYRFVLTGKAVGLLLQTVLSPFNGINF